MFQHYFWYQENQHTFPCPKLLQKAEFVTVNVEELKRVLLYTTFSFTSLSLSLSTEILG